ncbi:OmpA family protein [Dyadobacter sp. CY312]|uniref:OmpA family protein n=1 Tax=Dyadobacter sp. CY312 TaxID=2907303 RepID=UPI001F180140|nr:OmpA family protein [Dyadobacter sp. CY312]MCE7042062.1 OmpA family protein [Dyadobacter sp. CY312]
MNLKSLLVTFCTIGLSLSNSFGQITENPKVEEQSAEYVKIKKVELTDKYTIVYLQFNERGSGSAIPSLPPGFPGDIIPDMGEGKQSSTIWLDAETRLYKPGEVNTKFKLIRAENIPIENVKKVSPGEKVDFVAYFERLSPGIEIFDFYEGRSQQGQQSWNFYGIHIKNPLKKEVAKSAKVTPKAPASAPTTPKETVKSTEPEKPIAKPEEAEFAVIKGTVFSSKTKKPISAQISYQEEGDSLQISSSTGNYRIGINPKERYNLRATSKGFYGANVEVSAADSSGKLTFNQDIFLTPLAVGETIALSKIYFETSQFALLPESFSELNQLVQTMKDNPEIGIRVEGHTDNIGDPDKNIQLSRKRAESVKDYLIKNGIAESRIEAVGLGATRLLTKSGSEAERSKNRRVELVITGK